MATIADAARVLADEKLCTLGRALHIARRLQEDGILPRGRGVNAEKLSGENLADLLIAVGADTTLRSVPGNVATYGSLRRSGLDPESLPAGLRPGAFTVRDALIECMATFALAPYVPSEDYAGLHFTFVTNWPEVSVGENGERTWVFVESGERTTHWQNDAIRRETTITGRAVERIVRKLFH